MNYLKEINSFYDWLETNSISDSAITLWHALMHINNRAGWITEFAVAISTLETKTGLKKGAIVRARLRLQQAGRIDFKSRTGQQSAIYTISPFNKESELCSILERKAEHKPDTNWNANRTQSETQTDPINKLNKTKPKDDDKEHVRKTVCGIYQSEIGIPSPLAAEKLFSWIDDYSPDWVIEAIKEAVLHNARSPAYIETVLKNWMVHGFRTKPERESKKVLQFTPPMTLEDKAKKYAKADCIECGGTGFVQYMVEGVPLPNKIKCRCWNENS